MINRIQLVPHAIWQWLSLSNTLSRQRIGIALPLWVVKRHKSTPPPPPIFPSMLISSVDSQGVLASRGDRVSARCEVRVYSRDASMIAGMNGMLGPELCTFGVYLIRDVWALGLLLLWYTHTHTHTHTHRKYCNFLWKAEPVRCHLTLWLRAC